MYEIQCSDGVQNMFGNAGIVMQTEFHAKELIAGMIAHLRKLKKGGTISLYSSLYSTVISGPTLLATWKVEVVTATRVHYTPTTSY